MRAKIRVENAKSSKSVDQFPSVVEVLISFPVNEVVGSVRTMFMSEDPFRDEVFLGFEFNDGRRILMLIVEAGRVREEERDVEDGMNLEGRGKVQDEGDWGEFPDNGEGTKILCVELERGPSGGDVSGVEPNEIPDVEEVDLLSILVASNWSPMFPIVVLFLEVLSMDD